MAHPILHFQLILKDPDASSRFYTDLFGWTVEAPDAMGCRMLSTNAPDGSAAASGPRLQERRGSFSSSAPMMLRLRWKRRRSWA
jgi:predicted enzyme related to lactoylglutathione lyase